MVKEGLCNTCNNDVSCCFQKGSLVWQCEEFNSDQTAEGNKKKPALKVKKLNSQEPTRDFYTE